MPVSSDELHRAKNQLMAELEELQDRVKIKDNEIENPKAEIDNLKMLATKENSKRKTRKK
ncbi:MAG: hypothetical protein WD884_03975 [Nitrosopumilaceae archaeon]